MQFLKRREEALERYDTALKLYEQVGDKLGKANTLRAIGDVALANEQYPEALQHYRQALALVEQIHDLYSTAASGITSAQLTRHRATSLKQIQLSLPPPAYFGISS